jgi:hypothetical protein
LLAVEDGTLLVDPLVEDDDSALGALDDLISGRLRILITMPYHTRSAELLWRRYRRAEARIYGHPRVATRLRDASGFEAAAGVEVDGIARFHSLGSRSEQPIEIPAHHALVFGDAVVETGGGELRIWAAAVDDEHSHLRWRRYVHGLEGLADLNIEHVLVTHGRAAVAVGQAALRRAIQRGPWQRPRR